MDIDTTINLVTAITFAASAIASMFPEPKEGSKWKILHKIISFAAINVGKVKAVQTVSKADKAVDAVTKINEVLKKK